MNALTLNIIVACLLTSLGAHVWLPRVFASCAFTCLTLIACHEVSVGHPLNAAIAMIFGTNWVAATFAHHSSSRTERKP